MAEFVPVTVLTTNVDSELKKASIEQKIPIDGIYFDILSFATYYKTNPSHDWSTLEEDQKLLELIDEDIIRSEEFHVRQEYRIYIRSNQPAKFLDLRFNFATNQYKTKLVAVIDPSSTIPLKKGALKWIKSALHRKMILNGFLIDIYEHTIDQEINRFMATIQRYGGLKEPYKLLIGELFTPIEPINDKLILHYKNSEKSLISGVNPNDLIMEYIHHKEGKNGRTCKGSIIKVSEPKIKYIEHLAYDEESIRTTIEDDSTYYYAIKSGFIERKNGVFSISQQLQLESATFKNTGSIETGVDKDVSIKISKKVDDEDAVGTGINIDVQKLDVSGTIGSNATIQAQEVNIGSQTHKKSQIFATDKATVHLHRGNLKAKEAHVNILESGRIEADIAYIDKMVGGEVIAEKIYIKTLYSNAKIIALKHIEIDDIQGDGSSIIIDPRSIDKYNKEVESLESKAKTLQEKAIELSNKHSKKQIAFSAGFDNIDGIKKRYILRKKLGEEQLKSDIIQLQHYKSLKDELSLLEQELDNTKTILSSYTDLLEKLYNADLDATIKYNGVIYNDSNRVIFKDPKTKQEYVLSPKGAASTIRLEMVGSSKQIVIY